MYPDGTALAAALLFSLTSVTHVFNCTHAIWLRCEFQAPGSRPTNLNTRFEPRTQQIAISVIDMYFALVDEISQW